MFNSLTLLFSFSYLVNDKLLLLHSLQLIFTDNGSSFSSSSSIILFEVRRTSYWNDECPYEKCIPIKLTRVETRTLKTPEEFDAKFSKREGKWLEVGSNHRVDKQGFITRDREEEDAYGIEINSLEELMDFFNEVKEEIVLQKSWIDKETPCLEIYDTYRE